MTPSIPGEHIKNWAGRPLESFEVLLNYARGSSTNTGLQIEAYLDEREYSKGHKVSDKEFKKLNITPREELGKWNYTIAPKVAPEPILQSLKTGPKMSTSTTIMMAVNM